MRKLEIKTVFRGVDRITRVVSRVQGRVGRLTRGMARGLRNVNQYTSKVNRAIGAGLKKALKSATIAAVGLGAAVGKIIGVGADFEKTLVVAATKFPGEIRKGTQAFNDLEEAAREVGRTTEFTGAQGALALKYLGAAGLDVQPAISALPAVIDLATSAETDLQEATTMATRVLTASGLAVEDSTQNYKNLVRVMDVMKKASDSAAQEFTDVYEAMKIAASVGKDFNQDIETVGASLIGMAKAGFVGEQGGVAYRNMMLRISGAAPKAVKVLRQLGVATKTVAGNLKDPITIVGELSEKLKGLGTAERSKKLYEIFGMRAIQPASALLSMGTEKLEEFRKAGYEAAGTIKSSATAIRDTTDGAMKAVSSALESTTISFYKLKDDAIKKTTFAVAEFIRKNEQMIAQKVGEYLQFMIDNFDKIVTAIKAVGAVVGTVWALTGAIRILTGIMTVLNIVMAANPIILIIMAVIAAIGLAVGYMVTHWDKVKATWGKVADFFSALWEKVSSVFKTVIEYLVNNGPISWILFAVAVIKEHWAPISAFFKKVWDIVSTIFTTVVGFLIKRGPIGWMIRATKLIMDHWEGIVDFFTKIWDKVKSIFSKAVNYIKNLPGIKQIIGLFDKIGSYKEQMIKKHIIDFDETGKPAATTAAERGAKVIDITGILTERSKQRRTTEQEVKKEIVAPQDKLVNMMQRKELVTKNIAEITIKDETKRAKVTKGKLGAGIKMKPTGTF